MFKILGVTTDDRRKSKISLIYFPKDPRFTASVEQNDFLSSVL